MDIEFRVHTAQMTRTNARTTIDGEELQAQVECLEVELVTTKARHGTITLRFIGGEIAEAKEKFKVDTVMDADFIAKSANKPAPTPAQAAA